MIFIPLFYKDKLDIINPYGDSCVITLWSKKEIIKERLIESGVDMGKDSRIVAIGNLYGNGISHLIRNLAYNPQIKNVIIAGKDRSGSKREFINFIEKGTTKTKFLGNETNVIIGTDRKVDIERESFRNDIKIYDVGEAKNHFITKATLDLMEVSNSDENRVDIPFIESKITRKPGSILNHNIYEEEPSDCWVEVVNRCLNFGKEYRNRREIQNLKVVIKNPVFEEEEKLKRIGFSREKLLGYSEKLLDSEISNDDSYTYGNRICKHFGQDLLEKSIMILGVDKESRDAYITLWDNNLDDDKKSKPCLVSIYFRNEEDKLNMTATFRVHNVMDAWLPNCYGLINILDKVCYATGVKKGSLTIFSQSISVSEDKIQEAISISEKRRNSVKLDSFGEFKFELDGKNIVVYHMYEGVMIKKYKSPKPQAIQHQINKDCVISDINHAMYIGRQLSKAENAIKTNTPYIEE